MCFLMLVESMALKKPTQLHDPSQPTNQHYIIIIIIIIIFLFSFQSINQSMDRHNERMLRLIIFLVIATAIPILLVGFFMIADAIGLRSPPSHYVLLY